MNLKYMGKTGFMDLEHGKTYNVQILSGFGDTNIVVKWRDDTMFRNCLYSSPAQFAKDWVGVGQKVVVKKKKMARTHIPSRSFQEVYKYMKAGLLPPLYSGTNDKEE